MHVKMLIKYVHFHTNARKHKTTKMLNSKNTQTYLKSTQTHVKTQTYVNNYIGSRYIGNQWIYIWMLFIPIEYYMV